MVKLVDSQKKEETPKIRIIDEDQDKAKLIDIHEENVSQIDASCVYCRSIFMGDTKVIKCEKCGSYYHEPCLNKMNDEIKACRNCGAQISY